MEYFEVALIAFILLVVFFGMQVSKLVALLGQRKNDGMQTSVKTLISASDSAPKTAEPVQMPRKVKSAKKKVVKKAVAKKAPAKKSAPVKKTESKKTTTKKTAIKKTTAKRKTTKK